MSVIWGSNLAYFGKQGLLSGQIFGDYNRTVLRAFFGVSEEENAQTGLAVSDAWVWPRGLVQKNY
jgi:hypothetical protein